MPEPNQTCGTCIFWRRSSDQAGECRRNPPPAEWFEGEIDA